MPISVVIQKAVGGKLVTGGATGNRMTIQGSSSYSAANDANDVRKIQELLNLLAVPKQPLPLSGKCGPELVEAIASFQKLWPGTADGQVDPNGTTLRRMNTLATPLEPSEPSKVHPTLGAFLIKYTGQRPPEPYRVLLNLTSIAPPTLLPGKPLGQEAANCMEVTTRPSTGLLSKENLAEFLALVEKRKVWGDKKAAIRLVVIRDDQVVSVSTHKVFNAPVQPWAKAVEPKEIGKGDDGPKLQYIGTGDAPFIGRYFYSKPIGGKYYWKYGSELVTEDKYRGFDCITFVGSLYLMEPTSGADNPFANSQNMADALGAEAVEWTDAKKQNHVKEGEAKGSVIKKFFAEPDHNGTYLLWKGSHITLVIDKTVYEFGHSAGGYKETAVSSWVGDTVDYHLYSL